MNISIIGTGYVGLVSGVCFASLGHNIICVDVDKEKVDKINQGFSPIYEEGLGHLLTVHKDKIKATDDYSYAIKQSDITFICVGTPSKKDGDIDLSFVKESTIEIGKQLKQKDRWHLVVMKSTVIPGTTSDFVLPLLEKFSFKKAGEDFGVGMNPEFLREGVAVNDFLNPDRIVIGFIDKKSNKILRELYNGFSCPIVETTLSTAEMIKYASNCFLATKISFINEIGNFCKKLGIDTYEVANGMGLDNRIERKFLNAGIGWGGSCFGKDARALRAWAKKEKLPIDIIDSAIQINDKQPLQLIKILKKHIPTLKNKTIAVLGLAFKPDTDDIRDTRAKPIIDGLIKEKAIIKAYDPQASENFKKIYPTIKYCKTAKETIKDADAVLLTTDWDEFNTLDFSGKIVIDGRRLKNARKTARIYEGVCW
ncbi:MAG: UDP-glucose 6-dehydrogenase [Thermoplasmata archaeon M9B1D]|nr:MAG: UDP-glucose 6-dehydrogenase [Thermoplasmata archaeon M8B2D]PNX49600.1 MAG: UDP-glucose 6-dehydrogenase [Thermoplasmata archaeon M9B1D]